MKVPSKTTLVISPAEKCFKFLNYETGDIETFPLDIPKMDINFFGKLEPALQDLFDKTYLKEVGSFNVVIPDEYFGMTIIPLPKLKKNLSMENIKTELQARFLNYNELEFEFFPIAPASEKSIFLIRYCKKTIKSQFYKIFSNLKKNVLSLTPRFLASTKNLMLVEPKLKQRTFALFDIMENTTYLTICERNVVIGYHQFDFGRKILNGVTVAKEENLFNHKVAQLAVIKAKAAAKAKKGIPDDIVVQDDDEEEVVQDGNVDSFQITMENWDHFLKQVLLLLDSDSYYKNFIKFDDILFNMPTDLHYIIDNTTLESEFDASGMEVKRKQKVVNNLERKQPYAKKPQLRKREFAMFTKPDKKEIELHTYDVSDLTLSRKNSA